MRAPSARSALRRGSRPAVLGIGLELALAVSLVGALGVFHVWSRTRVLASGYALAELQQEHTRLVTSQDQLKIELGMLTSFQALDQAARTKLAKLGLAPPDRGAVWAAGPGRPPTDSPGRAGVDGVGHRPRPAGPFVGARDAAPVNVNEPEPAPEKMPGSGSDSGSCTGACADRASQVAVRISLRGN